MGLVHGEALWDRIFSWIYWHDRVLSWLYHEQKPTMGYWGLSMRYFHGLWGTLESWNLSMGYPWVMEFVHGVPLSHGICPWRNLIVSRFFSWTSWHNRVLPWLNQLSMRENLSQSMGYPSVSQDFFSWRTYVMGLVHEETLLSQDFFSWGTYVIGIFQFVHKKNHDVTGSTWFLTYTLIQNYWLYIYMVLRYRKKEIVKTTKCL